METFEKIKQDSRHFDVIELTRRINTERIFPDWNLALLSSNSSFSQEFQDKAINLDIQWDTLLNSSAGKSNEVFWRKVLNVIKSQTNKHKCFKVSTLLKIITSLYAINFHTIP